MPMVAEMLGLEYVHSQHGRALRRTPIESEVSSHLALLEDGGPLVTRAKLKQLFALHVQAEILGLALCY